MQQQAISLLTLNGLIKDTLDQNLSPSYWVIAEIGEFREAVRGHAYLELIEKTGDSILAKMRANIWSYTYQSLKKKFEGVTGESIKSGMKVLSLVNIQFHELYGLSLIIKDIDPHFTLGERARRRMETIGKLEAEGLMTLNQQFILPGISQKIAIVSSITAAGYGDFINQLDQNPNNYKVHYTLFQATMQGDQAIASLISAITAVEEKLHIDKFDLLVIIRGGGAQTDMDCFDDYELAKTIANAALPVITGIGHERDETIADLVAHTKLKTPTAVASFILSGFTAFEENLRSLSIRMERNAQYFLQKETNRLKDKTQLIKHLSLSRSTQEIQNLKNISKQLKTLAKHKVQVYKLKTDNQESRIRNLATSLIHTEKKRIDQTEGLLRRLNPAFILEKGYTRTEINGLPIHQKAVKIGELMVTFGKKQKIFSTINKVEKNG